MSGQEPFSLGSLTAILNGQSKKTWVLAPENLRHPRLYGFWDANPETQQVPDGEEVTQVIHGCSRASTAGSTYGLPYPQVCWDFLQKVNHAQWVAEGWILVNARGSDPWGVYARPTPYEIKETQYKTQYRYTFRIRDEDFPLVAGYPDILQTFTSDWQDYTIASSLRTSNWSPTLPCDPDKKITCGDLDTGWCCIDCQQMQQTANEWLSKVADEKEQLERMISDVQEING